jgi:hypothetical protein
MTDPIENSIHLIQRIEKTHKNLGLPTLFTKLVDFTDLGMFIIADRGRGKTMVLEAIKKMRHRDVMEVSILTFAGLQKMTDNMSDRSITMINKDFSTFYTPYLKDIGVNLISSLISDHSIKASTGKYKIEIQNCFISFLSATQPQMIKSINYLDAWESMYRDRFFRFDLIYPFGTPKYTKLPPEPGEYFFEIPTVDSVNLPKPIINDRRYERLKMVIQRQTSEGRCGIYVDKLLKAHAFLNNRDVVIDKDLEVLELFIPNLLLDIILSMRQKGVSEPMIFNANSYLLFFHLIERGETSRQSLREHFNVSHSTLIKNLNPLLATNLIKGSMGTTNYRVNPQWYDKYIVPITSWCKEHGIKTE